MAAKSKVRDLVRKEAVLAAARVYSAKNFERWGVNKIYGEQIQAVYKMAYAELAERYPKRKWLKTLVNTPSKDISLKLVLRVPSENMEIDLPDKEVKLAAIAHAGGKDLLMELIEILRNLH